MALKVIGVFFWPRNPKEEEEEGVREVDGPLRESPRLTVVGEAEILDTSDVFMRLAFNNVFHLMTKWWFSIRVWTYAQYTENCFDLREQHGKAWEIR